MFCMGSPEVGPSLPDRQEILCLVREGRIGTESLFHSFHWVIASLARNTSPLLARLAHIGGDVNSPL